jgi:hypothetical protein
MPEPIIVLGMHRSGTSAVTGVLTELGGSAPNNLMLPHIANERGFFESVPIMRFNDELLASAGSSWDDWRKFNGSWYKSPAASSFKRRATTLFQCEFGDADLPVLKDPRICRFAPFWIDVLQDMHATVRIVLPIRSPLEVAQSLEAAQRIPIVKGLLLWLRHTLDAEAQTRHVPRSLFTWDQFLSDWRRIAEKITFDSGLGWPRLSDRAARQIDAFLSRELVHKKIAHDELIAHSDIHEWTRAAYEALIELARNPSSNSAIENLNEIGTLFEQSSAMFGRVVLEHEIGLEQARAQADAIRGERDLLQRQYAEAAGGHASVRDDRDRLAAEVARSETASAEAQADRSRLLAELAAAVDERDRAAVQLSAIQCALDAAAEEGDRAAAQLSGIQFDLATSHAELTTRTSEVAALLDEKKVWLEQAQAYRMELDTATDQILESAKRLEQSEAELTATRLERDRMDARGARLEEALAESAASAEAQIRALRGKLIDAEAALAKPRTRAILGTLLPGSRALARKLIRSGLFDTEWYKSRYPDAVKNGYTPVAHYLDEGYLRGYQPNPLFDTRWYLDRYEDVRRSGANPLVHYMTYGFREGRNPGPGFETDFYLEANPDVRSHGMNPLAHYLKHGRHEGRVPAPSP